MSGQPEVPNYTIIISPGEDAEAWVAEIPALDIATQGLSQVHAAEMAKEAILLHVEGLIEEGRPVPPDVSKPFHEAV